MEYFCSEGDDLWTTKAVRDGRPMDTLRAKDRLSEDFADAPPDRELSRGERVAWDIYAVGRTERAVL